MTYNEIIDWLEWMSEDGCPQADDVLALINRQKAEIERLKEEKDNLIRTYAECQAEAVKEFAERLKRQADGWYYDFANFDDTADALTEIDNLVKEFAEGG